MKSKDKVINKIIEILEQRNQEIETAVKYKLMLEQLGIEAL